MRPGTVGSFSASTINPSYPPLPPSPLIVSKTAFRIENSNGDLIPSVSNPGDVITYQITVTSPVGTPTLENVQVVDPLLSEFPLPLFSGDPDGDGKLDPGETWVYRATYEVTQVTIDSGPLQNTATLTASSFAPVTASCTVAMPSPLLSIDKMLFSVSPPLPIVAAGAVITYRIVVSNPGKVTLTNVVVTDPKTGLNQTIASLAPSASQQFTTTYTVTQNDIDTFGGGDGDIDNTATADSAQTPPVADSVSVPLGP